MVHSFILEHLELSQAFPKTDQTNHHWIYVIALFAASVQLLFRHAVPLQPSGPAPHGALAPEPGSYHALASCQLVMLESAHPHASSKYILQVSDIR